MSAKGIRSHKGIAAPMLEHNINTDTIIPSHEMKRISKRGLAAALFANRRYRDGPRRENPDFILNQPPYKRATILLAGQNTGCGSSREHAVWALRDYGFRAILAQGFATIFRNNCVANGIVPATLAQRALREIADWCARQPEDNLVVVNLEDRHVRFAGNTISFSLSESERDMLMKGYSAIDITLRHRARIEDFTRADRQHRPWIYDHADS